jgi:hypothetical protein
MQGLQKKFGTLPFHLNDPGFRHATYYLKKIISPAASEGFILSPGGCWSVPPGLDLRVCCGAFILMLC